jgi:uncharacterized protein VirK/YbjX
MWAMGEGVRLLRQCAPHTTRWEQAKFVVRYALRPRLHERWVRYLTSDETTRAWVRVNPSLPWKLQRPYGVVSLRATDKLRRLIEHYDWLVHSWPAPALAALQGSGELTLATLSVAEAALFRLTLGFEERFAKEGELALSIYEGAVRLGTLVFSVSRQAQGGWSAHVGCLQGPGPNVVGRDVVRDATKTLHGLRPKQALLQALYVIAHLHGVKEIICVSNASHVYQTQRRRGERVNADYDGFWSELGALRRGALFVLPERLRQKSIEETPSRKRAQYRRRHELEMALSAQIEAVLRNDLPRPPVAVPVAQTEGVRRSAEGGAAGLRAAGA